MKKVIIYGINDISQLAKFYFENETDREIFSFCVDSQFKNSHSCMGKPIIEFEEIEKLDPDDFDFFIPLYDNKLRESKAKDVKSKKFNLTSFVSPRSVVWSPVGENCFVMENNVIQPFVNIGNNIIFWSGNHIGHHSTILDSVFFSSHVVLSGHCIVNKYCWLGVNSTIRDHVELAEGTFVCMSSAIISNTNSNRKYKGNPAVEVK